jgi:hypothetical protein
MFRSHLTCNPGMSFRYLITFSLMQKGLLTTAIQFLMVSVYSLSYSFPNVSAKHLFTCHHTISNICIGINTFHDK